MQFISLVGSYEILIPGVAIYVQPLGDFPDGAPSLESIKEYTEAFYTVTTCSSSQLVQ